MERHDVRLSQEASVVTDTPDLGGKLGPFLAKMVVLGGMTGSGNYMLPATLGAFGLISIFG